MCIIPLTAEDFYRALLQYMMFALNHTYFQKFPGTWKAVVEKVFLGLHYWKKKKKKSLSNVFLFLKELFADFWDSIHYLNKCPLLCDFCSYEAEEGAKKIQGMNYSLQSTINDSHEMKFSSEFVEIFLLNCGIFSS